MIYLKNLNNNAALVKNNKGKECIVIGNGIGFGKHTGDQVDETKIERCFVPSNLNFPEISEFKDIEPEIIEVTSKVIKNLEKAGIHFSDYQYLVLADHIGFTLKRSLNETVIPDGIVRWNIIHLFSREYQLACQAIKLIENELNVILPENEKVFMTYHLLDAESDDTKLQDTIKITELIGGIVSIIQYEYKIELDKDSFNYSRFVNHLRALMIQHISGKWEENGELDSSLFETMKTKYPKAVLTVERIDTFLLNKTGWKLGPDDKVYLILHIWRVTHRQVNEK